MKKTTITTISIEYNEQDSKGYSKLQITQGSDIVLTYYGPFRLLYQSVTQDAIGEAIMALVRKQNREYNANNRTTT